MVESEGDTLDALQNLNEPGCESRQKLRLGNLGVVIALIRLPELVDLRETEHMDP